MQLTSVDNYKPIAMADEPAGLNIRQNSSLDFDNFGVGACSNARVFISGNQPNSVVTHEGLTVVVCKGNICDQMVDGLANSIGAHFNLSEGAIAKSLLQRAGSKLQQELTKVKPKGDPRAGDVTVTQGYDLHAKYVFHGVLKKWDNVRSDAEAVLRYFIKSVLREASNRRLNSVAFPAVGTGLLSFPAGIVAECLFNECDKFSSSNPQTTVSEVRLVVFEKDAATFKEFENKVGELQQQRSDDDDSAYISNNRDDTDTDTEEEGESNDDTDDDDDDDGAAGFDFSGATNMIVELMRGLKTRQNRQSTTIDRLGLTHPDNWEPPDPHDPYRRKQLSPSDAEYKSVVANLQKSANGTVKQIIKIERIENHSLWQLYMVHRDSMKKTSGSETPERVLWHGTCIDALNNIYAGGFNRSYCGKNATVYGQGVYFAADFNYSARDTYSPADKNRNKYIFQCRVLTGNFTVGDPSMIEPPMRSGTKFRYDSVVNDKNDPRIFVIFKDSQAYPEYLVCFKG